MFGLQGRWLSFDFGAYAGAVILGLALAGMIMVSPVLAAVALITVLLIILTLQQPIIVCYVYGFAIIFLSGMPRDYLIPLFVPNEPIMVAIFGLGFLIVLLRNTTLGINRERMPVQVIVALVLLFLGTALLPTLTYMLRGWRMNVSAIFSLMAPMQYLLMFWLYANLPENEEQRLRVVHFMMLAASVVSVTGLLQAVEFPPMMAILNQFYPSIQNATAIEAGRVTSILNAWNSLGNFLMINLVVIISVAGLKKGFWYNLNLASSLILSVACLLASGSFASVIGFGIAIVIAKWFDRRNIKLLFILAGIALLAFLVLYPLISARLEYQFGGGDSTPQTLTYRFYLWETVFFPALGKGNNFLWGITPVLSGGIFSWAWTENQYLYLLVRSGLVSLIGHLAWIGLMLAWLYRLMKRAEGLQRALAVSMFALLITLSIMGMTNEVFTNSGSIDFLWMYLGLAAKEGVFQKKPRAAPKPTELQALPAQVAPAAGD